MKIILIMVASFLKFSSAFGVETAKDCFFTEDPLDRHILLEFSGTFFDGTVKNLSNQLICTPSQAPEALISTRNPLIKSSISSLIHTSLLVFNSFLSTSLAHAQDQYMDTGMTKTYDCKNGDSKLVTKLEVHPSDKNTAYLGTLTCRRTNELHFNLCLYNWKWC